MKYEEFLKIYQQVKLDRPILFDLEMDNIPLNSNIRHIESYYNIALPESYKKFLLKFGGGNFAFTIVYSLDEQSVYYIKNNVLRDFVSNTNFLPVIDFETGDVAGFRIKNNKCESTMTMYNHEDKKMSDLNLDFYELIIKYGFDINNT